MIEANFGTSIIALGTKLAIFLSESFDLRKKSDEKHKDVEILDKTILDLEKKRKKTMMTNNLIILLLFFGPPVSAGRVL